MLQKRVHVFPGREVKICNADSFEDPAREKERRARLSIHFTMIRRRCAALIVMGWFCGLAVILSGCGGAGFKVNSASVATGRTLEVSPSSVDFGNVNEGQAASAKISLLNSGSAAIQISQLTVSGQFFSIAGQTNLPVTIAAGGNYSFTVQFNPTAAGSMAGQLTITSNSSNNPTVIDLSGSGVPEGSMSPTTGPTLSGLSCAKGSMTGAGSDACTVTLAAAGAGGLTVSLASNNTAVTVPASVTVPAGSTSVAFTATVAAVTSAETATLMASAGGGTETFALQLSAMVPTLSLSASSLTFGDVTLNSSATQSVTLTSSGTASVTVSAATVTGTGFSVSGATFPLTLNPGQTATLSVKFDPAAAGAATGTITLTSNAAGGGTATIGLSGTGEAAPGTLSGLSCTKGSITGAGSDACTVTLTAAAGAGGLAVSLASNNAAVTVPASVIVPAGSTNVAFTATVAAVTSAETATLTASAGGGTETFALQLSAVAPTLSLSASSLSFGDVVVNTPATQSVTLTSSGTASVTVSAATVTGTGFSMSGASFPLTLNLNQNATLEIEFDPTTAGAASGQLTIISDSLTNPIAVVSLSGTGEAASYEVQLTWNAPTNSSDPVVGYEIYRANSGNSSYQLLNSAVDVLTAYTDSTVVSGASYTYYVESVDASGNASAPSNTYTVNIP